MESFKSSQLFPFLQGVYDPAHSPTNFTRWYSASSSYDIAYSDGYAPQDMPFPGLAIAPSV